MTSSRSITLARKRLDKESKDWKDASDWVVVSRNDEVKEETNAASVLIAKFVKELPFSNNDNFPIFKITVPSTYPFDSPKVIADVVTTAPFTFHPNIETSTGKMCVESLSALSWSPAKSILGMLEVIATILETPTVPKGGGSMNHEAAALLSIDTIEFWKRARLVWNSRSEDV